MSTQHQDAHIHPTTHKSYVPLTPSVLGQICNIITDVNVSVKDSNLERRKRKMITRYYSVKTKSGGKWNFVGHAPRIQLMNATFHVSQKLRDQVIKTGSKIPHAFIKGTITFMPSTHDDKAHSRLLLDLLNGGAKYIHYCPYRTSEFVTSNCPGLPNAPSPIESLTSVFRCRYVYAFETGVIGVPYEDS